MDKSKTAVEIFDKRADLYQEKYMDVSLYGDTFDLFCSSITRENATIIELACGPGNITRYLLNKRPDLKILGTDLAPKMIELAGMNNPGTAFELMDCRDLGKMNQQYDAIMCGFCLPYLSKEEAITLIRDASTVLKRGGIFYISTMEDDYSKSAFQLSSRGDRMFIHYHESGYLTDALKESGFNIIDLTRKKYAAPDGTPVTDLVIIAERTTSNDDLMNTRFRTWTFYDPEGKMLRKESINVPEE